MPLTSKESITNNINNHTTYDLSFQNSRISQRLCELLSWNDKTAFRIEKDIIQTIWIEHKNSDEETKTKKFLIMNTKNILTKEEFAYYSNYNHWEVWNFMHTIKQKIAQKNIYDTLSEDVYFKTYTTTYLLAQKMVFELWIRNKEHELYPLLASYIQAAKPHTVSDDEWITIDDAFFEEIKKAEKAKNPITFIDLEHSETRWDDMIHVKMWLYLLICRKNNKQKPLFFTLEQNDIQTFSLRDEWLVLFERIFNAWCGLHRELLNDPNQAQITYTFKSINDIQRLLLWQYRKPWSPSLPIIEQENLEWYIDMVQCLFHIWSHKLRWKSWKKQDDQFVSIVERSNEIFTNNARQSLFDLQPFWHEVVNKFSEQISWFNLFLDAKKTKPLTKELFEQSVDKKTLSWSMTTFDNQWNEFLFTGRCKQLDKIVNKMLNSAKYNHIDAFNDILWARFELVNTQKDVEKHDVIYSLFAHYMDNNWADGVKYFSLKWQFTKYEADIKDRTRSKKLKNTQNANGINNPKTALWYSEMKLIFNWYEIQLSLKWNNTSWNKDDSIYWFKKIVWLLWRIKKTILYETMNIKSMQRWIEKQVKNKRYEYIKNTLDQLTQNTIKDSQIIEAMCTILLVHEMMLEELQEPWSMVSWSILYAYAKTILPKTKHRPLNYFDEFEKQRWDENWKFSLSFEQLKSDNTPLGKDIYNCIIQSSQIHEVYRSLETLKEHATMHTTETLKKLDEWLCNKDIEQKITFIMQNRIQNEKIAIEQNINNLLCHIGGWNYEKQIKELILQVEQGKQYEGYAKHIFWEALLDKKNWERTNALWHTSKKVLKLLWHWFVNKLNWVLSQSWTYIALYPQLNEQLETLKNIHQLEKKELWIPLYRQWKADFFSNKNTPYGELYQAIYQEITQHSDYADYYALIDTYLWNFIENEISKTGEWAMKSEQNQLFIHKINPAKTARIKKMHDTIYAVQDKE